MISKKPVLIYAIICILILCVFCMSLVWKHNHETQIVEKPVKVKEQIKTKVLDYTPSENSSKVSNQGLIFLGDSIMLRAKDKLLEIYPDANIDAAVSRQIGQEQEPYENFVQEGKVNNTVVIGLGTNGYLDSDLVEQILNKIGDDKSVFWINVYCPNCAWQDANNAYLEELKNSHTNLTVIDWYSLASQHVEWFTFDQVHPSDEGVDQYVQLIQDTISRVKQAQAQIEREYQNS